LKKRSKKLLSVCVRGRTPDLGVRQLVQMDKSLFASFSSEKEDASFTSLPP
jgi:hypothetical protein